MKGASDKPDTKLCICAFLKNVQSPGHDVKCPVHPRGKKLQRDKPG